MQPQQQAAILRQIAADLEHGKCSLSFLAAVLAGLLGAERPPRPAPQKRRPPRPA